jgi:hypothetical protein
MRKVIHNGTRCAPRSESSPYDMLESGPAIQFRPVSKIKLQPVSSLFSSAKPHGGDRCPLRYDSSEPAGLSLEGKRLTFRARCENDNPIVTLHGTDGKVLQHVPRTEVLLDVGRSTREG